MRACLVWLALACLPQALPAAAPVGLPAITVRVLPGTDPSILQELAHVRPARGTEPVTLQLDLAHQRILDGAGRVVAGREAVRPLYRQSVVDKWRYVAALTALARARPQAFRSNWADDASRPTPPLLWVSGTSATFVVPDVLPQRQLLVFGIGPAGDLYFMGARETGTGAPGETLVASAVAIPPFGAEHIVAVTAADPPGMHDLGVWLLESANAHGLIDTQGEVLKQIEALRDVRIGLLTAHTCNASDPGCTR